MLDCKDCEQLLSPWIDGRRPAEMESGAVKAHLDGCARCRATVKVHRRAVAEEEESIAGLRKRRDVGPLRVLQELSPLLVAASVVVLFTYKDLLRWSVAVPMGVVAVWLWNTIGNRIDRLELAARALSRRLKAVDRDSTSPSERVHLL